VSPKGKKTPLAFKPFSIISGIAAGAIANAVFKQVWTRVSKDDLVPDPTDPAETWGRLLLASAIQGLTFAVIKVAADRGAAALYGKTAGVWPGEEALQA
jgi:hypothetical protein